MKRITLRKIFRRPGSMTQQSTGGWPAEGWTRAIDMDRLSGDEAAILTAQEQAGRGNLVDAIYADLRKGIAREGRRVDCGEIDRIVGTLDRAIAVIPAAMVG